jgi:hypothetical protein
VCVAEAVRLNKNTADKSNESIKDTLKGFFQNAKKRAGGRGGEGGGV